MDRNDQLYALAAQAKAATNQYGVDTAPPPPIPLTAELSQRLSDLRSDLGSTLEDLGMLNERLFGPSGEKSGSMAVSQAPGIAGGLTSQLDDLRHVALNVSALARGLNGRI